MATCLLCAARAMAPASGGSQGRTAVLDKIFNRLRRTADFRQGDVEDGRGHVGRGEWHEDGRQAHQDEESGFICDRGPQGKEKEERAQDDTHTGNKDAPLESAFE